MPTPEIFNLRKPMVWTMILFELAGLAHYWATGSMSSLIQFLILSILGTTAMIVLLWLDVFEPLGVSPGVVAYCLMFLSPGSRFFLKWGWVENTTDLAFAVLVLGLAAWGILENRKAKRGGSQKAEGKGRPRLISFDIGPLGCLALSVLLLFKVSDFILFGDHSPFWLVPVLPPFCWYLWQYILHRKQQKQLNPTENLSILQ